MKWISKVILESKIELFPSDFAEQSQKAEMVLDLFPRKYTINDKWDKSWWIFDSCDHGITILSFKQSKNIHKIGGTRLLVLKVANMAGMQNSLLEMCRKF